MADGLRALRWRAALGLVGLGLVFAYVSLSGRTAHTVRINYQWGSEMLDSAEVEIDGEVVGVLRRYGRRNFVTGFRVEPGEHVVRVLVDGCTGVPESFQLGGMDGRIATFMADVDDDYDCRVLLR